MSALGTSQTSQLSAGCPLLALFGPETSAGRCPFVGVERTPFRGASRSEFDPLRKSATGSGSGSGRLVVEIVGGITEVSLHVRYGGISGPRSAPYQTDV